MTSIINLHVPPEGGVGEINVEVPSGDDPSKYKDTMGRFRTLSLFREFPKTGYPAFFTLKRDNRDGYTSMYLKYMEISDPTEYKVAIQLLGSWQHWVLLTEANWFKEHLDIWREELKVKLASERYHEMLKNVDDPKTTVAATKWLADNYGEKHTPKRGRPSATEKQDYLRNLKQETSEIDEDAQRIGLIQ